MGRTGVPSRSWVGGLTLRVTRTMMVRYLEWYHRIECSGTEHVPLTGPLLVVANHASNLDPLTLAYGIRRPLHFLAARGLFRIPPGGIRAPTVGRNLGFAR